MANITTEIIERRDRDTKHFATDEPGTFVAVIQKNQHFWDAGNGKWIHADEFVQRTKTKYKTKGRPFSFELDANTGAYSARHFRGWGVSFQPTALYLYDPNATNPLVKLFDATPPTAGDITFHGGKATRNNVFPDVHIDINLLEASMTKAFVFTKRPTLPDLLLLGMNPKTTRIVVAIDVTSQFPLLRASTGEPLNGLAVDNLYVQADNKEHLLIPKAQAWGSSVKPSAIDIEYLHNEQINLGVAVPYIYFQRSKFPFYIDPTVTITTNAGSWGYLTNGSSGFPFQVASYYIGETYDDKTTLDQEYRYYERFDVSSIPAGSTCTSAYFQGVGNNANIAHYPGGVTPTFTLNTIVASTDWGSGVVPWLPAGTAGTALNQNQFFFPITMSVSSVSDGALNNGWQLAVAAAPVGDVFTPTGNFASGFVWIYYCPNCKASAGVFSIQSNGINTSTGFTVGSSWSYAAEFSHVQTSNPLENTATNTGYSASPSAGPYTVTNGSLEIQAVVSGTPTAGYAGETSGAGSGWTDVGAQQGGSGMGYKVASGTTATAAFDQDGGIGWVAAAASFLAQGGTPTLVRSNSNGSSSTTLSGATAGNFLVFCVMLEQNNQYYVTLPIDTTAMAAKFGGFACIAVKGGLIGTSSSNFTQLFSPSQGGAGYPPRLIITYTAAAGGGPSTSSPRNALIGH